MNRSKFQCQSIHPFSPTLFPHFSCGLCWRLSLVTFTLTFHPMDSLKSLSNLSCTFWWEEAGVRSEIPYKHREYECTFHIVRPESEIFCLFVHSRQYTQFNIGKYAVLCCSVLGWQPLCSHQKKKDGHCAQ